MRGLIIIPTYNERDNIIQLIDDIFSRSFANAELDILVIDDNSLDGTGHLIEKNQALNNHLYLLQREKKLGLASAYIAGFKFALSQDYEVLFVMDADYSHNPNYLQDFLLKIRDFDVVIGSRYIPQGGIENWRWLRRLISKGGNIYARWILGTSIHDLTSGFRCFRRKVLERINFDKIKSEGYVFHIEMAYIAYIQGFRITEIPIIFKERLKGKSKISRKILFEALYKIPWIRLTR